MIMSFLFLSKQGVQKLVTSYLRQFTGINAANQNVSTIPKPNYRYICAVVPPVAGEPGKDSSDGSDIFGNLSVPLEKPKERSSDNNEPKLTKKVVKLPRLTRPKSAKSFDQKLKHSRDICVPAKAIKNDTSWMKSSVFRSLKDEGRMKNQDADQFGLLVENDPNYKKILESEYLDEDDDDDKSVVVQPTDVKRKRIIDYVHDMRNLARSGHLKEALDLLDWVNTELKWKHESSFIYTMLIGFCGKAGYTEKAFLLFKQMKERGLKVTPAVLTGLFNSCAECPFPEKGLQEANYLQDKMKIRGWQPSTITYHAMIKAFGRCGDLEKAFQLVDEMIWSKHAVTSETFNFLLMACISDKKAGFTHAVLVLRKMNKMRIRPSVYSYDLLLRAVRDCGVGPSEIAAQLLLDWKSDFPTYPKRKSLPDAKYLEGKLDLPKSTVGLIQKGEIVKDDGTSGGQGENRDTMSELIKFNSVELVDKDVFGVLKAKMEKVSDEIDLLAPKPQSSMSEVVALSEIKFSSDRLKLIGGIRGMMKKFRQAGLKPTIKTFTILLGCIPPNKASEDELLSIMGENDVRPDIDFFNVLMKKRGIRYDSNGARNILDLITKHGLLPDIATFGVLAISCRTTPECQQFLKEMQACGVRPNVEIFGSLVHGAKRTMDLKRLLYLLKSMKDFQVKPDPKMLKELEEMKIDAKKLVIAKEDGKPIPEEYNSEDFVDYYSKFCLYYNQWLKSMQIELPQHPWKQYKEA